MKKLLLGSITMLLTATLFAQPGQRNDGPPKPPPIAERWKHDSIKLQLYVSLQPSQAAATKSAFFRFYKDMDGLMDKSKGTPPSKDEGRKIHDARNAALKSIFAAAQYDRFETFELEFMPPPPHPPMPGAPKPGENL